MHFFYNIQKGTLVTVIEESFVASMLDKNIGKENFTKIVTTKDLRFSEAEKVVGTESIKLKKEFIGTLPKNDTEKYMIFLREGWYLFSIFHNVKYTVE